MTSADLEDNGVLMSEKGTENMNAALSKQQGEMDNNAKPTSTAGRTTNGASISNKVAVSCDSWLDSPEHSLDKVIAFLCKGHVDDKAMIRVIGLERAKMAAAKMVVHWQIRPVRAQMPRKMASSLSRYQKFQGKHAAC